MITGTLAPGQHHVAHSALSALPPVQPVIVVAVFLVVLVLVAVAVLHRARPAYHHYVRTTAAPDAPEVLR